MNFLEIAGRRVGPDFPPLVIAEIGINHEGSLETAVELADCALRNGAEVIKHQTHIISDEMSYVARLGKPMIVSTGMNSIESLRPTVQIMREHSVPFALLHCTNIYPTDPELVRLNAMEELADAFPDAVVGLSDHSLTNYPCIGAVALGASILERHFTDSYSRPGPDISCSMDGPGLAQLIEASRIVHAARGSGKGPIPEEAATIAFAFASVAVTGAVKAGEILTESNIFPMRPAGGDFGVADYDSLLGRRASRDLEPGTQLRKSDVL